MQNPIESAVKTKIDHTKVPEIPVDNKTKRVAEEAAHKAAKTEQEYDGQHTIISK